MNEHTVHLRGTTFEPLGSAKAIGAAMKAMREEKGVTLTEAGKMINYSHSRIWYMENGDTEFKPAKLHDLVKGYGGKLTITFGG